MSRNSERKALLTPKMVRDVLDYVPETGELTWKVALSPRVWAGKTAGYDNATHDGKKQVQIGIYGTVIGVGPLIWFYVTGAWPIGEVDHWDGNHTNQRWRNLRDVASRTNIENQRSAQRSNKSSGLLGVSWSKKCGKWQASITHKKKAIWLGYHDSKEEAHQAYLTTKRRLHAGCTI